MNRMLLCAAACGMTLFVAKGAGLQREFLQIAPRCAVSPVIDGKLDEPCWKSAPAFRLSMREPDEKTDSSTDTRIVWDEHGIYVGVLNYEKELDKLKTLVLTRDGGQVWNDDSNEFFFFPTLDKLHYYKFDINSIGKFSDWYRRDFSLQYPEWNADVVKCASGRTPEGWTIEFFLSWKDLEFEPAENKFIGFLQTRFVWKAAPWLTRNSNTGGNFFNPKFAWVYLVGPGGATPGDAARALGRRLSGQWFAADDNREWLYVNNGTVKAFAPAALLTRFRAEAESALTNVGVTEPGSGERKTLDALRKRLRTASSAAPAPATLEELLKIIDEAGKLAETISIQKLF